MSSIFIGKPPGVLSERARYVAASRSYGASVSLVPELLRESAAAKMTLLSFTRLAEVPTPMLGVGTSCDSFRVNRD
jgi:hypothetical protein